MIACLKGVVAEINEENMVMFVGGVGYELLCSGQSLDAFQSDYGTETMAYTYTHVREDALQLFGFATREEKQMFLSLLKVNGVGPKMAIHALGGSSVENIRTMIESEDVKGLSKLPKVGKKTAEQMILTLKGKLVLTVENEAKAKGQTRPGVGPKSEMVSALINLGFRSQDVDKVVADLPGDIALDEGIRKALSALTSI